MAEISVSKFIQGRVVDKFESQIIAFTGYGGSGKSYSAMTLAHEIDPSFTCNKAMSIADIPRFIQILNDPNRPPGSAIVLDEAALSAPKHLWYSLGNQLFNYILQVFRVKQTIAIMTLPSMRLLDNDSKILVNSVFHCYNKDMERGIVRATWKKYIYDDMGKSHIQQHHAFTTDEGMYYIPTVDFHMPPQHLIDEYEPMHRVFKDKLMRDIEETMKAAKPQALVSGTTDVVDQIIKNPEAFINIRSTQSFQGTTSLNQVMIAEKFGLNASQAFKVKKIAEDRLSNSM